MDYGGRDIPHRIRAFPVRVAQANMNAVALELFSWFRLRILRRYRISDLSPDFQNKIKIGDKIEPGVRTFCWLWTASKFSDGYSQKRFKGRNQKAHRPIYELLIGPIPDGLTLDHLCRVRHCVNPRHVEPVTLLINQRRGERATQTHCIHGHELSGYNLIMRGTNRKCRKCHNQSQRLGARR